MRVLLDTSILIGADPGPIEGEIAISAVSLAELHFGVLVARSAEVRAERLRRLGTIERTFDALALNEVVAREYGRLSAAAVATDRQPRRRAADLMIAATAAAYDATLWTRNPADLAGLEDLVRLRTPDS